MARDTLHFASSKLDAFATSNGFTAPSAYFITGEFNLVDSDGAILYSDEAHLWCRDCATATRNKAITLIGDQGEADHDIYMANTLYGEETPVYCSDCGEVLDHTLSSDGCILEIDHYEENPSADITPREAFILARILDSAAMNEPLHERALYLARETLSHLHEGRIRT